MADALDVLAPVDLGVVLELPRPHLHLVRNLGVLEVLSQVCDSLKSPVSDVAKFLGGELAPFTVLELPLEFKDEQRVEEVDESVADVGFVYEVNGQIDEIVLALVVLVDFIQKGLLLILVRNMLDHHCSPQILTILNLVVVNDEYFRVIDLRTFLVGALQLLVTLLLCVSIAHSSPILALSSSVLKGQS